MPAAEFDEERAIILFGEEGRERAEQRDLSPKARIIVAEPRLGAAIVEEPEGAAAVEDGDGGISSLAEIDRLAHILLRPFEDRMVEVMPSVEEEGEVELRRP